MSFFYCSYVKNDFIGPLADLAIFTILKRINNKYKAKIIKMKFLDLKNKLVINSWLFQISAKLNILITNQNIKTSLVKEKKLILEDIIKDNI